MKICIVHNDYGAYSGEEAVVAGQRRLLEEHGHQVCLFTRSSAEIPNLLFGRLRAFCSGLFNPFSRRDFRKFLQSEKPDIVHVHNLFPLVSPSILPVARQLGIPVVMTVHNYRLVCPNGLHFSHGEVCTRCAAGKEYWCARRNCEGSMIKSVGYALRSWWARKRRYYLDCVSVFACLTQFQKDLLMQSGIPAEKIRIVPNMLGTHSKGAPLGRGKYVGFCGRLSPEKGIDILVEVARRNADIQFVAAGSYEAMPNLESQLPENFMLLGHCGPAEMQQFYEGARMIVLPSVCFEGFPMVLLEAMLMSKAIVCSDIGGLSDIVDEGTTGLLARPSDPQDLGNKILTLWKSPELCRNMGIAGRQKVMREYSREAYYHRLSSVYQRAMTACAV
jgi:glycosyltransferase involved in cell wall biosynthesis